MINFKQFFQLLLSEGGNVFKATPTSRIYLQNIQPTVKFVGDILGINLLNSLLGSTGKRESSGDLDIAIDENKHTKQDIVNKLTAWCQERNLNPKEYIAKTGISVHFRAPIVGEDGQFVQTDLMLVPNVKFAQFALANNEQAPFKGVHRNIILSNLAKNIGTTWSNQNGLLDRQTRAVIESKNPNRVAQLLLGSKHAKGQHLESITNILNFLSKKYTPEIVASMLNEARTTILKDGVDIMSLLNGYTIQESSTSEGDRVGVQHLYSQYKSDQYSMNFESFKELLKSLQDSNGVLTPGNSSVSEKADGMSVKFGITSGNEFFLQSSYSGPVTDGNFEGRIKYKPVQQAFELEFNKIKKRIYKVLKHYKQEFNLEGVRVQAEWLYSPLALSREDNPNMVYFVATNYAKDKLGTWSTFPIINVTDTDGNELPEDQKYSIINAIVDTSDQDVKFLPLDIEIFNNIDLSSEMRDSMQEINTFESQYPNYESILYNTSRKQDDVRAKKAMRTNLISRLLPYQRRMHEKILAELDRLAGILGEYEGLVIKVKNSKGEPFIFKVISPTFHKNKGRI